MGSGSAFDSSTLAAWTNADPKGPRHLVQFYEDDSFLLEIVCRLVGDGLDAGDSSVVVATAAHREGLAEHLRARGLDPDKLAERGRYIALDAADTLARFMVDDWPDAIRFNSVIGGVIERAAGTSDSNNVRAFGEMVALLWSEGNREAAVRLEELWNELSEKLPFSLCCGYPLNAFSNDLDAALFLKVCAEHSHVVPAESYSALTSPDARLRSISHLQQKASLLDAEATRRREAEKSLNLRKQELADFLENAVEGLQRDGADGKILWANPAQLKLLGYSAEEYVGHHLADFWVDRQRFEEFWRQLMDRQVVYDFSAALRCRDGSVKQVLIHSSGLWENGEFQYTRCFIRDVTERVLLESELRQKIAQLDEADKRKNEFLAMLGHELRNPLSAITYALSDRGSSQTPPDKALDIARRQAGQLARLIDDLLDIARITQGRIALHTEPSSLASILDRALEQTRYSAQSRRMNLVVSLAPEERTMNVSADPARLQQVISNLIHNAIKFSEPGGNIDVSLRRKGAHAVLRVRDRGIGISHEMLPRIFDLFTQADAPLHRANGGLGIGLTLVKQLVEMHGGRIQVRSEGLGKGTEFEVSLPMLREQVEQIVPDAPNPRSSKCASVLVVEDNPDVAESLTALLEALGHRTRVASDGLAALEVLRVASFDAVLVDIGLPGIDGYEVARRIRMLPNFNGSRLIALTGYGQEEDRQRALRAGFDQHLVKPVNVDHLETLMAEAASSHTK